MDGGQVMIEWETQQWAEVGGGVRARPMHRLNKEGRGPDLSWDTYQVCPDLSSMPWLKNLQKEQGRRRRLPALFSNYEA